MQIPINICMFWLCNEYLSLAIYISCCFGATIQNPTTLRSNASEMRAHFYANCIRCKMLLCIASLVHVICAKPMPRVIKAHKNLYACVDNNFSLLCMLWEANECTRVQNVCIWHIGRCLAKYIEIQSVMKLVCIYRSLFLCWFHCISIRSWTVTNLCRSFHKTENHNQLTQSAHSILELFSQTLCTNKTKNSEWEKYIDVQIWAISLWINAKLDDIKFRLWRRTTTMATTTTISAKMTHTHTRKQSNHSMSTFSLELKFRCDSDLTVCKQ